MVVKVVAVAALFGRIVPSFRIVLDREKRNGSHIALRWISQRKGFDDTWEIPRLYITAYSHSV
jgi:hypothetical protein